MLKKASSTINTNKMSVLGFTFADIDGQSMAFLQTRFRIFLEITLYFPPK